LNLLSDGIPEATEPTLLPKNSMPIPMSAAGMPMPNVRGNTRLLLDVEVVAVVVDSADDESMTALTYTHACSNLSN